MFYGCIFSRVIMTYLPKDELIVGLRMSGLEKKVFSEFLTDGIDFWVHDARCGICLHEFATINDPTTNWVLAQATC